ncbi:hypothetical protein CVT26_012507 [Gymnopilus dilepis]|uniref:Dienelactone hydrolase domain-containing protein n=1 Tax=Gymnopilus dilepis TaxID=231916 RepID=A0A409YW83_9AGAR|nr:hypothetical protein CVT26_012507 [Gymnopilus dilepis]
MSFCDNCVKGVIHEGTPKGKWEKLGGVDCYVAAPTIDYPKDKAVLFMADIFGAQLVNAQVCNGLDVILLSGLPTLTLYLQTMIMKLMADAFAENGFFTVIPDYLNGDPIPLDGLDPGSGFDIGKWLLNHGADQTRPPLDKVINALKVQGVTGFGATGYCFGGRYVFDLAFENVINVGVVAHPSLLQVPADLEKYFATSRAPLLINSCPVDSVFPPEGQAKADEIFGGGKFAPGYKRNFYEGCTHGFAVRGDLNDPNVKVGKEAAFRETVEWFIKYL